jgi:hypothetical protein
LKLDLHFKSIPSRDGMLYLRYDADFLAAMQIPEELKIRPLS